MKKLSLGAGVLAALLVSFFVASPHLALSGLREALVKGDSEDLRERVDFPALRESPMSGPARRPLP
jgi:hypothetical protein